jgi:hypothetical protein
MQMQTPANPILCDGCSRPASPAHIAERVARLERATRFRPVHINVLFVAFAPAPRPEDDFYGPPQSNALFDSLLDALDIAPAAGDPSATLAEFQRKGYYLSYLSECATPEEPGREAKAISALSPALIRRIRFNYKPKHIVLLGAGLASLIEILEESGLGPLLLLDRGGPVSLPVTPSLSARAGFRAALGTALSTGATSENRLSDYDRMQSNQA